MKVLHVLETSLPDTGGYTIRAQAILTFQQSIGIEPVVVTSPLFPGSRAMLDKETIDGIPYYRTNHIPTPKSAPFKLAAQFVRAQMLMRYRRAVTEVVRREQPDIIHAHSSYMNAHAAHPAARKFNLPLLYEVRTLWGESAVVEDGLKPDSLKHRVLWRLELAAMRRADLLVPIAKGIRDELIRRGIPPEKLEIVGNGVDAKRFVPRDSDGALIESFGLGGAFVIGFVGTMRKLEGLSTLVEALAICRAKGRNVRVVIVGDGPDRAGLQAKAEQLGLSQHAVFVGTVPHGDVERWYSVMDLLVYPRTRAVINERVTPLKPLEAMALGKVCVVSNVGGLTELVRDNDTGVVFAADDPNDLASKIGVLMDDPEMRARIRSAALAYVRGERSWSTIIQRYRDLYEGQIRAKRSGQQAFEAVTQKPE